jgi:hypothetical protein
MDIEIFRALAFSGVPIFLCSYLLFSRAMITGRLSNYSSNKDRDSAIKAMSKSYKEEKKQNSKRRKGEHRIIDKWLFFGGGFYGLMALVTFVYIEIGQIISFFIKLFSLSWSDFWSRISIDMLIALFIDAIMNLVDAFVWFAYWNDNINMQNGWYWLVATYLGYVAGTKAAMRFPCNYNLKALWQALMNRKTGGL